MPQVMRVVRCYKCEIFQVDIEKQSNKWRCKMCDEKQSLKKVYNSGTGKDCRKLVQELNLLRLEKDDSLNDKLELLSNSTPIIKSPVQTTSSGYSGSKWDKYVEKVIELSSDEETYVQASPPKKRARYSSEGIKQDKNLAYNNTQMLQDTHAKSITKKGQKRPLASSENDTNNHPLAKYSKKNNSDKTLDKAIQKEYPKTSGKSKWLQYLDDNEDTKKKSPDCKDEQIISQITKRKRTYDESNCTEENLNWNIHTEWDSFSEPSPSSIKEVEINDIIDDQFEEFENRPETSRALELFSTVQNNSDLDTIFTL